MPSIWSKAIGYVRWFLWGKTSYSKLSKEGKQEARRDLYFRLFLIANAPFFGTMYVTFLISIKPVTALADALINIAPGKRKWKNFITKFCFGLYIVLHAATFIIGANYVVIPCYELALTSIYSWITNIYNIFCQ